MHKATTALATICKVISFSSHLPTESHDGVVLVVVLVNGQDTRILLKLDYFTLRSFGPLSWTTNIYRVYWL